MTKSKLALRQILHTFELKHFQEKLHCSIQKIVFFLCLSGQFRALAFPRKHDQLNCFVYLRAFIASKYIVIENLGGTRARPGGYTENADLFLYKTNMRIIIWNIEIQTKLSKFATRLGPGLIWDKTEQIWDPNMWIYGNIEIRTRQEIKLCKFAPKTELGWVGRADRQPGNYPLLI